MAINQKTLPEISIKEKKSILAGQVVRCAIYADSKVFQVMTAEKEQVYLVYFKNTFIFGGKLNQIPEHSFIEKAFQDGFAIDSSHPIITSLIPDQTVTIPSTTKLFHQLETHFSPQQTAYITVTLDSFFEKNQLIKEIDKVYLECRRNGKFLKAFQVLRIVDLLMPEWKFGNDRMSALEFQSCRNLYQSSDLGAIFQKDPLYSEIYCFQNRLNQQVRIFFEQILTGSQRYPEIILLWLENVNVLGSPQSIETYTKIALRFSGMKEWLQILMFENINPFFELPEAKLVIEKMIEEKNFEEAALFIWKYIDSLPSSYDSIEETLWANLDTEFVCSHLDRFISNMEKQMNLQNPQKTDAQILKLIDSLLKGYDLTTVYKQLSPLIKVLPNSIALRKLAKMAQFLEDPDHMMDLGDYYAEFHQYDKAIDCYYWEMELWPQNPDPVWKLSKMYQHKGMAAEASAFQKVFNQLKNIQESV
jgi:tetratricopeptide (TPR) repeat protein